MSESAQDDAIVALEQEEETEGDGQPLEGVGESVLVPKLHEDRGALREPSPGTRPVTTVEREVALREGQSSDPFVILQLPADRHPLLDEISGLGVVALEDGQPAEIAERPGEARAVAHLTFDPQARFEQRVSLRVAPLVESEPPETAQRTGDARPVSGCRQISDASCRQRCASDGSPCRNASSPSACSALARTADGAESPLVASSARSCARPSPKWLRSHQKRQSAAANRRPRQSGSPCSPCHASAARMFPCSCSRRPSRRSSCVEPSMSVNSSVTVPCGNAAIGRDLPGTRRS
jgi:hypothetical protein